MRLFVGVAIDSEVTATAGALIEELRRRASTLAPRARITWIPEERLHLTVRFIGNTDEEKTRTISEALEPPFDVPPFALTLAGIGAFPRSGKPQVLWAGLTGGLESLQRVEREVTARLVAAGVPPEDRAYSPHLTLARIREAAGLRSSALFDGLAGTILGTTHVEAITLFESRLSPEGPTYFPLQRTALR
jgi:2'-5' RNA ligase